MKKSIVFICFLITSPHIAQAAGCGCGSINSIVAGHAASTVSSVNTNTNIQANMLKMQILEASRNIIGTLQSQTKSIVSAIQLLKETQVQTVKSKAIADQAIESEDVFGTFSQPDLLCGASSVGAGLQIGNKASSTLKSDMRTKQIKHSNSADAKPVDFINRISDAEHPKIEEIVQSIFPQAKTLKEEEVIKAHEALKTLGNPFPLPVPTEEQLNTPAGEGYHAAKTIQEGRIGVGMDILNEHIAFHAPTLPPDLAKWAEEQWKQAGAEGDVPSVVDGKLSQAGLFNILSQLRIANPNWIAKLGAMPPLALQREQVFLDALNFELARKNNELLSSLLLITTLEYLTKLENNPETTDVYNKLIKHQQ